MIEVVSAIIPHVRLSSLQHCQRSVAGRNNAVLYFARQSSKQRSQKIWGFKRSSFHLTASANPSTPSSQAAPSTSNASLVYTSFEGNSWKVDFQQSGVRVLVDPWLVGKLVFGGQDWLYAGSKKVATPENVQVDKVAQETDFILLSQSIDDHAHRPTLQRLPKSLPVVGSPSAAKLAKELGFQSVMSVDHGEEVTVCGGKMKVRGTAGALVGPPWSKRENGFVLTEIVPNGTGLRLYYEPHCDFEPSSVAATAPVDVVVTPPASQVLLGYPLVKGSTDNGKLLSILRPKVVIPLLNAEFESSGPLSSLVKEVGSVEALQDEMQKMAGLQGVAVRVPSPGQPMPVSVSC